MTPSRQRPNYDITTTMVTDKWLTFKFKQFPFSHFHTHNLLVKQHIHTAHVYSIHNEHHIHAAYTSGYNTGTMRQVHLKQTNKYSISCVNI